MPDDITPTTPSSLTPTTPIVEQAADALRGRRTRAEAQGRKRKTTLDVYEDAWVNFAAFMDYREASTKATLLRWAKREYYGDDRARSKQALLAKLEAQLGSVDHHDVLAYKTSMLNQPGRRGVGLAASTVGVRLAALTYLFKIARREGVVEYNPASPEFIDRMRGEEKRHKHVLQLDEVKAVLDLHAPTDPLSYRNHLLFKLLAWTGMRRQEASELFVQDIDSVPDGLLLTLRRKGDKTDVILAPAKLEAQLLDYIDALQLQGPVFPAMTRQPSGELSITTNTLTPGAITAIVRDMTRAALGVAYGPHRLRHFFANTAWDGGSSIEDIQQYLGHESPKTTKGYLALKPRRDRSAAEVIDLDG